MLIPGAGNRGHQCHLPPALGDWCRGKGAAAHLERFVLALGGFHEQVGPFAVTKAVSRALEQQEGQGQLGEGPLHPCDGVEQLDAEAHLQTCPTDEWVRVVKLHLQAEETEISISLWLGLRAPGPEKQTYSPAVFLLLRPE